MIDMRRQDRKKAQKKHSTAVVKTVYNKLTNLVKEEIAAYKNKKWNEFINSLGKNPVSTKPFWQKINKIKNKNKSKKGKDIPTLLLNNISYTTKEEKADLFGGLLEQTFKDTNDEKFDKKFENKIKKEVNEFKNQNQDNELIFDEFNLSDLNKELKSLKKCSAVGKDKTHNLFLINASTSFKLLILSLINETV
jgi:hypothetical protein